MIVVPEHVHLDINTIFARLQERVIIAIQILIIELSLFIGETRLFKNRSDLWVTTITLDCFHVTIDDATWFILEKVDLYGASRCRKQACDLENFREHISLNFVIYWIS